MLRLLQFLGDDIKSMWGGKSYENVSQIEQCTTNELRRLKLEFQDNEHPITVRPLNCRPSISYSYSYMYHSSEKKIAGFQLQRHHRNGRRRHSLKGGPSCLPKMVQKLTSTFPTNISKLHSQQTILDKLR